MREHALPQDITGYKFHIIGNMTLKQFVEVATGFVIAFFIYQTNLVNIVKWPMMAFFAGMGAMVAFVPIEERPLDQWILAFFRALYRPTQYYWKRIPKIPEPFLYEAKASQVSVVGEVDLTPARRQRVKEYLRSIGTEQPTDQIESYSTQRLDEVMGIFQTQLSAGYAQTQQATPEVVVENLSFVGRATGEETNIEADTIPSPEQQGDELLELFEHPTADTQIYQPEQVDYAEQPLESAEPTPETIQPETIPVSTVFSSTEEALPETDLGNAHQATAQAASESMAGLRALDAPDVQLKSKRGQADNDLQNSEGRILTFEGLVSKPEPVKPKEDAYASTSSSGRKDHVVEVPETQHIRVEKTTQPITVQSDADQSETTQDTATQAAEQEILQTAPQPSVDPTTVVQAVVQNPDLPFLDKPTMPNKVVGMVLDPTGAPLPNAIVEILTESGLPARAVKTNPLGQFFITTPLNVGQYLMTADYDGFKFETKQLIINDQILDPIEVRALAAATKPVQETGV